jgi:Ca2+-binding EF-hand superfamily protein
VVTQLYTDLKLIFDKYDIDRNEELDDAEFEALLRGLLKENSQQELDYIFWNMFRVDRKGKGSVEFEDFVNVY